VKLSAVHKKNSACKLSRPLQERVAKLAGGVAVIKVGAATEVEMLRRHDKKPAVQAAGFFLWRQRCVMRPVLPVPFWNSEA
jgi:hypothetical protein